MYWSKIEGRAPKLTHGMPLLCSIRIAVLSVFFPFRHGIAQFDAIMCEALELEATPCSGSISVGNIPHAFSRPDPVHLGLKNISGRSARLAQDA